MKKHYVLAVNGTMELVEVSKDSWHNVMHDAGKYATIEKILCGEELFGEYIEMFLNGSKLVGAIVEEFEEKEKNKC